MVELKNIGGNSYQTLYAISIPVSGGPFLWGVATKPENLKPCEQEVRKYWRGEIQHVEVAILTDRVLNAGERIFASYGGYGWFACTPERVSADGQVGMRLLDHEESHEDCGSDSWPKEFILL